MKCRRKSKSKLGFCVDSLFRCCAVLRVFLSAGSFGSVVIAEDSLLMTEMITRRRKLKEDAQTEPQENSQRNLVVPPPPLGVPPCESGTVANPSITIIIGTTAFCVNTKVVASGGGVGR